jgi:hypothetical protein
MSALASSLIFLARAAEGFPMSVRAGALTKNLEGTEDKYTPDERREEANGLLQKTRPVLCGPGVEHLVLSLDLERSLEVRSILLAPDAVRNDDIAKHIRRVRLHRLEELKLLAVEEALHSLHVDTVLVGDATESVEELGCEGVELGVRDGGKVGGDDGWVLARSVESDVCDSKAGEDWMKGEERRGGDEPVQEGSSTSMNSFDSGETAESVR